MRKGVSRERKEAKRQLKERLMKKARFSEKDAEAAAAFWTKPITAKDERRILLGED